MAESSTPRSLDALIARLVDGIATPEEIAALERQLDGDTDAQRRYIHYADLHAELAERSGTSLHDTVDLLQEEPSQRTRNRLIASLLAAAVLVAAGMGIGRWSNLSSGTGNDVAQSSVAGRGTINSPTLDSAEQTDDGVAVLSHVADVRWDGGNSPNLDTIVSPGKLKFSSGLIQLDFYNGVQLLVEGPADLEIVSVASVICREGKLRSLVPPNAKGFSVLTPKFELVDLGTEFAVDVGSDGRSDVHVFDGEVQLYSPDGKREPADRRVLLGGDAMAWSTEGTTTFRSAAAEAFTSFEDIRIREETLAKKRFEAWLSWNQTLQKDSRIVAHYDFQSGGSTLHDRGKLKAHGTIIGCEWTPGRWPEKPALEFKRPGDRVRIDVPGQYDSLTMSAWVRLDALPMRRQSLLLTDRYEVGRVHWQIGPDGELRIGSRIPPQGRRIGGGYASPPVFVPRQIGVWNFVCSTYDRKSRAITHWFNGRRVFSQPMEVDQPIQIGSSEIGNWGVPHRPQRRAIRNLIGRMDELTIWNVALDDQLITELYNRSRP